MRKFGSYLYFILLLKVLSTTGYSQARVSGFIFEINSGKVLSNANIFLSGTGAGTTTDKNGYFELKDLKPGPQRLVISMLGYETVTEFLQAEQDSIYKLRISLIPRIYSTATVNISSKGSEERRQNLDLFKEIFLGKSKFAKECLIENEPAIIFTGSGADTLCVSADNILYVANNALGYKLEIVIDKFSYNKKTKGYKRSFFPKFSEMNSSLPMIKEKWHSNRKEVYSGSLREFLLSLVDGTVFEKGYLLYLDEPEKGFRKVKDLDLIVKKDSSLCNIILSFSGTLVIKHGPETSNIQLNKNQIIINKNGFIKESFPFQISGSMAQRGIAQMLPDDYEPGSQINSASPINNSFVTNKAADKTGSSKEKSETDLIIPDVSDAAAAGKNLKKFEHLKDSLQYLSLKYPKDIATRLKYAAVLNVSAKASAYNEYKSITEYDPHFSEAWFQMGRLLNKDYRDSRYGKYIADETKNYNFSRIDKSIGNNRAAYNAQIEVSLEPKSKEIFKESEMYLLKSIELSPVNEKFYYELCTLYECADKYDKLEEYAQKFVKQNPQNKDAHLFLGLAAYKTGELQKSWAEFKTALGLMTDEEKQDYEYSTVLKILEPMLGDKLNKMTDIQTDEVIRSFWKSEDPLYLTEYNERQLEHYSRVLRSNLQFGVTKKNIPGWKTDRGEIYLRYGPPLNITNYPPSSAQEPYIDASGAMFYNHIIYVQTELWEYGNMDFSFSDYWQDGNYQFSDTTGIANRRSHVKLFSRLYAESARKTRPEKYEFIDNNKVLPGLVNTLQFKNLDDPESGTTDFYVNFAFTSEPDKKYNYEWGFFCFDNSLRDLITERGLIKDFHDKNYLPHTGTLPTYVFTRKFNEKSRDVKLAFEAVRNTDSSIFTSRGNCQIKDFTKDSLMISDIILSSRVEFESKSETAINRNSIWILPDPASKFSQKDNMHIYYEIYNLGQKLNGQNDFDQEIIIGKKNSSSFFVGKMIGSLVRFFDKDYSSKKIAPPSIFRSFSKDQQMCYQLGVETFDAGEYEIELIINDTITGQRAVNKTNFTIK